jgi:two-component system OmpR family sensor kinase
VDRERRLLSILERLFELSPAALDIVLSQSADLIASATQSEKVDAFLHEAESHTLVAVGTSHTALGAKQRSLGLHLLPVANAGRTVQVFQTGRDHHDNRAENDREELRGLVEGLKIRSVINVPLEVAGVRRGVLTLASTQPDVYSAEDVSFTHVVAGWVGGLVHRAELLATATRHAREAGRRVVAEELVTVLAHDLRNLVFPIAGRVGLTRDAAARDQRQDDVQNLDRALSGLDRLSGLVSDLLDVARLDNGLLALDVARFDLLALLREASETVAPPSVEVRLLSHLNELQVCADRPRVRQAIENVLSNAVKHSPAGAPVVISVETTKHDGEDWAKLSIVDQGPGIAADLLPHIFERYIAGRASSGLGLGLYLARRLLEAHNGSIAISCDQEHGTRCELSLPLRTQFQDVSATDTRSP